MSSLGGEVLRSVVKEHPHKTPHTQLGETNFRQALDQERGQTPEPKLIKPTWEKDFDQLGDSDRSARIPDYRDGKGRRTAEDIGPL